MAAITTLTPDIQSKIPEIPAFIATREIIHATREFCEFTRAWRVDIQVSTTADTATVDLTNLLPTGTELVDIISMKNVEGSRPVLPTTQAWLDTNTSDWRGDTALDANYYVLSGNNTIQLVPTPSTTVSNQYYVRVAVKPLLATATTFDDVLVNKYDQVLVDGALARLYLIPRKPWTDTGLGAYHRQVFMAAMPSARTEAAEEFQTGVARKVKYGGL